MDSFLAESSQKGAKGLLDVGDYFLLLDPLGEWLFSLSVVVYVSHVAELTIVIRLLGIAHEASLAPSGVLVVARELFVVDKGRRCTRLVAIAHPLDCVELALGSPPLVDGHVAVILVVEAGCLVAVELWHGAVVPISEIKRNETHTHCKRLTKVLTHRDDRRETRRLRAPRTCVRHPLRR